MLDYVVDPKGNAIAYFYSTQTNYYAGNGGTAGTQAYTQGGMLAKIEYGLRAGSIYTQTPAAVVTFTPAATVRSDAPTDLACAKSAACAVTAPTFWTSNALASISTQALVGGSLQPVDTWALAQTYPATGDSTTAPSLWLSSITRTGQDGTTPVTLPPNHVLRRPDAEPRRRITRRETGPPADHQVPAHHHDQRVRRCHHHQILGRGR